MTDLQICAAHPAAQFSQETTELLSAIADARVVSVGPPPGADSLEEVVEAIEAQRRTLGIRRWVFWGMSGGGFLGQIYARRHPSALAGVILASCGPYFRQTVEDPACILCPQHLEWREKLAAVGLLDGRQDTGATEWQPVDGVGWVFRRASGAALLVSPDEPSAELQRMMPALWEFDARGWLAEITVPALVTWGTADPVVPVRHAQLLATLLPKARLAPIAGAGHIPLTDRRSEVEQAIRGFLTTLRQDAPDP
jgi:pimeloyl-ACP methyl ester carboxylesterase